MKTENKFLLIALISASLALLLPLDTPGMFFIILIGGISTGISTIIGTRNMLRWVKSLEKSSSDKTKEDD